MIDEELYQFATEELNSDRRNSELWNRACALARDDHDEARYLYTNIRVEELLEQHASGEPLPLMPSVPKVSSDELSLESREEPPKGLENDLSLDFDTKVLDDSASEAVSSSNRAFGSNFDTPDSAGLAALAGSAGLAKTGISPEISEEVSEIASQEVVSEIVLPDTSSDFRATPSTLELGDTPPDFDMDAVKAMNQETEDSPLDVSAETKDYLNLDALPSLDPEISSLAASASQSMYETPAINASTQLDDAQLADAHVDDALDRDSASTIESPLDADAQAIIDRYSSANSVDSDIDSLPSTADRPLMNETLDNVGPMAGLAETANFGSTELPDAAGQASSAEANDLAFLDANKPATFHEEAQFEGLSDVVAEQNAASEHPSPVAQDYSAPGAGAALAATAGTAALAHTATTAASAHSDPAVDTAASEDTLEREELLSGSGRLYRVFSRGPDDTRAVRRGMSWSALFFTLPWLLVKRMPGMAIVYALLWIVLIGGLLVTGIDWLDLSTNTFTIEALWPLAFAALAVIGLIILPLFMANRWHANSLMGRGYDEIATVRAKSKNRAVERIVQLAA